jgi:acetolactate synthase-1/2/3 large subunit
MAEGYARATGKAGVVLTTSGPGITNLVTPMQDALCDGTPMVIFYSQMPKITHGNDEFQAADVLGISKPCTKWNIRVRAIDELPQRISEAFEIAVSGQSGPVLVEIPKHVISGILTHVTPTRNLLPKPISVANIHTLIDTGSIPKFAPKALIAAAENRGGIIQFEIAPKNVNKVVQATEAVLGDCAINLQHLTPRIKRVDERPE